MTIWTQECLPDVDRAGAEHRSPFPAHIMELRGTGSWEDAASQSRFAPMLSIDHHQGAVTSRVLHGRLKTVQACLSLGVAVW